MKINNIKENKSFQIFICIMMGCLILWAHFFLDKRNSEVEEISNKIEKNII